MADDCAARAEELEAIAAIFGDDAAIGERCRSLALRVREPGDDASPRFLTLSLALPDDYPSSSPPTILGLSAGGGASTVAAAAGGGGAGLAAGFPRAAAAAGRSARQAELLSELLPWAAAQLRERFTPGEVAIFAWAEWLREQPVLWPPGGASSSGGDGEEEGDDDDGGGALPDDGAAPECAGRTAPPPAAARDEAEEAAADAMAPRILTGAPYTVQKSTFQAHVAPVASVAEVRGVVAALMRSPKIRAATHNIMAFRIHDAARGTFNQDADDDGEAAAGGRLLHLLQIADARGVCVVVSRWFGGILLGPSRFGIINHCARGALEEAGFIARPAEKNSAAAAKGGGKGRKR
jgi:hypothetical protein